MKNKNEARKQRRAEKDRLTNQFMIQLSYGVLGIVILYTISSLYKNINTLVYMNIVTWVLFGIFAVASIVMIITGAIKKLSRVKNYGYMFIACSIVSLWLSLYNPIRPIMQSALRNITGNDALSISSMWNTRIPMIAIVIYLVVAFIVYCVKVSKK